MNTTLWILQLFLAGLFSWDGYLKVFKPGRMRIQGLNDVGLVLFIGVSEILGAMGLILPALTRIFPWLTPLAAAGIAIIMVLASRFHVKRREGMAAGYTLLLLVLSVFVALGRWALVPLS